MPLNLKQRRSGIVGAANIGSSFGTILVFIGLMLGAAARQSGSIGWTIAVVGLILMSAAVFFSLVTLPVELNASARAREMLMRNGLVNTEEAKGVSSMLNAAALTYIAGAAQAVMQLLYFALLIFGGRRRD